MPITVQEAGRRGAAALHSKPREERSAIARKGAATRLANDPEAFIKQGQLAAIKLNSRTKEERSKIGLKSAKTRRARDPQAFVKMGKMGGRPAKLYGMG
jgi:general stress protein YciG